MAIELLLEDKRAAGGDGSDGERVNIHCNKKMNGPCLHAHNLLHSRMFRNRKIISAKQQHQRSNSFQDSTILSICFEVLNCMSMMSVHEDAEQELLPFPLASPKATPLIFAVLYYSLWTIVAGVEIHSIYFSDLCACRGDA